MQSQILAESTIGCSNPNELSGPKIENSRPHQSISMHVYIHIEEPLNVIATHLE